MGPVYVTGASAGVSRAVLLTLCLFAAPLFCNRPASADDKPVLIVFDFTSSWDKGKMGRKIAGVFRERVFPARRVHHP